MAHPQLAKFSMSIKVSNGKVWIKQSRTVGKDLYNWPVMPHKYCTYRKIKSKLSDIKSTFVSYASNV